MKRLCLLPLIVFQSLLLYSQDYTAQWPPIIQYGVDRLHKPALGRDSLRIASMSILPSKPERTEYIERWISRRGQVIHLIRDCHIDVIGCQRTIPEQIRDICRATDYRAALPAQDTLTLASARLAVLYDPGRLRLISSEFRSQSGAETDARNSPEGYTVAEFEDRTSGKKFCVFNCLLRHPAFAREAVAKIKELHQVRVVVTADLMAEIYEVVPKMIKSAGLKDSYAVTAYREGAVGTFHNFQNLKPLRRMDYVFVSPALRVSHYEAVDEAFQTLRPASDHVPVMADIVLK